jgi:cation diffusion facilitator CzcD-associated flavoprotein CzcO
MADRRFRVVVAGAGVSGLFMAETLKRARIDFAVYERAGVGGDGFSADQAVLVIGARKSRRSLGAFSLEK